MPISSARMSAIFACCMLAASQAYATPILKTEDDKSIFSLVYENDIFAHEDRGYTNGVRLGWQSSESQAPEWVKWSADHFLPLASDGDKRLSIAVGQNMYTPADLTRI